MEISWFPWGGGAFMLIDEPARGRVSSMVIDGPVRGGDVIAVANWRKEKTLCGGFHRTPQQGATT